MDLKNNRITVRELLADPRACNIIKREFPGLLESPAVSLAMQMPLSQVLGIARRKVEPAKLQRVLNQIQLLS